MQIQCKTLTFTFSPISSNHKLPFPSPINLRACKPPFPSFRSSVKSHKFIRNCSSPNQELVVDGVNGNGSISRDTEEVTELVQEAAEVEVEEVKKIDDLADQSIWGQMKEIVMFTGPAAGLWICGPLMSLIDTAVICQGSSVELAALGDVFRLWTFDFILYLRFVTLYSQLRICYCLLPTTIMLYSGVTSSSNSNLNFIMDETGPATVVCDYLSYTFMFLSVATSNLVATSLARGVSLLELNIQEICLLFTFISNFLIE